MASAPPPCCAFCAVTQAADRKRKGAGKGRSLASWACKRCSAGTTGAALAMKLTGIISAQKDSLKDERSKAKSRLEKANRLQREFERQVCDPRHACPMSVLPDGRTLGRASDRAVHDSAVEEALKNEGKKRKAAVAERKEMERVAEVHRRAVLLQTGSARLDAKRAKVHLRVCCVCITVYL